MKLIQISDLHFLAPGRTLFGLDPRARFEAAVADINANHGDAALCIVTGDLADGAAPEAYAELRAALAGLRVPHRLLIGNHDDRAAFRRAFPETPCDEHGFVQSVARTPAGDLVLLDTVEAGQGAGRYCATRQAWLAARLAEAGTRPVYLFMHHPPCAIGIPAMDRLRLQAPEGLARVLAAAGNVRHIFFGHVHRPVSGSWCGIPFAGLRSTVHQVALSREDTYPIPFTFEPPGYHVILIEDGRTVVHHHDFLDETRAAAERMRMAPEAGRGPG